jgi:UDP-galactopyranose mutase
MSASELAADYMIVGAGAVGMAMADTLLAETSARMIIVDRRAKPGGRVTCLTPSDRRIGGSRQPGK